MTRGSNSHGAVVILVARDIPPMMPVFNENRLGEISENIAGRIVPVSMIAITNISRSGMNRAGSPKVIEHKSIAA